MLVATGLSTVVPSQYIFLRAIELTSVGVSVQRSGDCANQKPELMGYTTRTQNEIEEEIAAATV